MNIREDAAQYYDLQTFPIDDVGFYLDRVPSPQSRILELGCGTGRVLIPLARKRGYIHGIDASAAMLEICREKLRAAGLPDSRVGLSQADVTDFQLDGLFDLIVAPFRVLQNLEADAQVAGLLASIRWHLLPGGYAILNAFLPNRSLEEMRATWCVPEEQLDAEIALPDGGRIVRTHRRPRLQADPLVVFPEIIYRRYSAVGALEHEAFLKIAMRCWYPDDLVKLVEDHEFSVTKRWGGYAGEKWGAGPELVIQFDK